MKLKTRALGALGALAALLSTVTSGGIAAAADRPYTEGQVLNVSAVRTEPGMFEEYMKYLAGPYKQLMEQQKKAGIVVDYAIYSAEPRGPHDPDLYLVIVYKNMAALDDLNAKTDALTEKVFGTLDQQTAATVQRGKLRTLVGSENIRQLILK
jgi:L-rhamnose mutarotase